MLKRKGNSWEKKSNDVFWNIFLSEEELKHGIAEYMAGKLKHLPVSIYCTFVVAYTCVIICRQYRAHAWKYCHIGTCVKII